MKAQQLEDLAIHMQTAAIFAASAWRRVGEAQRARGVGPWESAIPQLMQLKAAADEAYHFASAIGRRLAFDNDAESPAAGEPMLGAVSASAIQTRIALEYARRQLQERALDVTSGEVRA